MTSKEHCGDCESECIDYYEIEYECVNGACAQTAFGPEADETHELQQAVSTPIPLVGEDISLREVSATPVPQLPDEILRAFNLATQWTC